MSSAAPRPPAKGPPRADPRRDDHLSERKEQREDKQRQERLAFTQLKRQMSVAAARQVCLTAVDPLGGSASRDERRNGGSSDSSDGSEGNDSDSGNSSSDEQSRSESAPTAAPHCHSAALARYTQRPPPEVIPPNSIRLTYLHSFLSADECVKLIELSQGIFVPSRAGGRISSVRTSHTAAPSPSDPVVQAVRRRVAQITGKRDAQIETLNVVRYEPGQQYRPHYDSSSSARGYLRSHTIFAYLNDLPDGDGGETEFTKIGVKFKPKKGDALLWENQADKTSRHRDGEHAGRPPLRGVKYGQPPHAQ